MGNKVALGLSGGVDSAVSVYLLTKQGYDVSCIYLNCYDPAERGDGRIISGCRGDQDRKDALVVAMHLGLPFQVLDFRKEYKAAVIDYFKKEYKAGRTPNPDIVCNREIKFGLFYDWAMKNGFDYIATGHYAKTWLGATPVLRIPKDLHKDQTYFLWAVPREKFEHVLFPLGDLLKSEVRAIAKKIKLPVAEKKDSTGICFVGEVRVEDFLKRLGVKEKPGEVVIRSEKVRPFDSKRSDLYTIVGTHRGVWFYTIGQRHGFEVNRVPGQQVNRLTGCQKSRKQQHDNLPTCQPVNLRSSDWPPLYVIEKDVRSNHLIVGFGAETYQSQFRCSQLNWLVDSRSWMVDPRKESPTIYDLASSISCLVRIRHGGELIPCSIKNVERRTSNVERFSTHNAQRTTFIVRLREPQRGIAPGQSAVFYLPGRSGAKAGEEMTVLGGGIIQ